MGGDRKREREKTTMMRKIREVPRHDQTPQKKGLTKGGQRGGGVSKKRNPKKGGNAKCESRAAQKKKKGYRRGIPRRKGEKMCRESHLDDLSDSIA